MRQFYHKGLREDTLKEIFLVVVPLIKKKFILFLCLPSFLTCSHASLIFSSLCGNLKPWQLLCFARLLCRKKFFVYTKLILHDERYTASWVSCSQESIILLTLPSGGGGKFSRGKRIQEKRGKKKNINKPLLFVI